MDFVQNYIKDNYKSWKEKINILNYSINEIAEKINIEETKLEKALTAIFDGRAEPTLIFRDKMEKFLKEELKRENYGFCESRFL